MLILYYPQALEVARATLVSKVTSLEQVVSSLTVSRARCRELEAARDAMVAKLSVLEAKVEAAPEPDGIW